MGDYFLFFIFIMGMRDSNLGKIYWKHLVISLNYMTLDNVNVLDVFFYSDLSSKKISKLYYFYI